MNRNSHHQDHQQIARDCLVAVSSKDDDLRRFSMERWYRIPGRAIGRQLAREALMEATTLALYQTAAIRDGLPGAIELWGEIEDRLVLPRRDIIPEEPYHPAADEPYHLIRLKNIDRLDNPIITHRPRRVTFIRTTRQHLLHAADLNELIIGSRSEERLWQSLREEGQDVERRYFMRAQGVVMELDFALFRTGRCLGIQCGDDRPAIDNPDVPEAWGLLRFSPARIDAELDTCLQEISLMAERMARAEAPSLPQGR